MVAELESSGGGSQPVVGAHAHLDNPIDPYIGGAFVYDIIDYDTDGFWNVDHDRIVIPVGLGGLYLIQAGVIAAPVSDNIVGATCDIVISGTAWNLDPLSFDLIEAVVALSANVWRGSVSAILPLSDAGQVYQAPYWKGDSGYGPPTPDGAVYANSYLGVFRIGDLAT